MLALITGRGALPAAIAAAQIKPPLIYALEGHVPDAIVPHASFRIEHLGSLLDTLRSEGVDALCLCGAIDRPQIDLNLVDAATRPLLPRLAHAVDAGEDSALRAVISCFEEAGFKVCAAHHLAPELCPPAGVLTAKPVSNSAEADVAVALQVLNEYGAADLGQACIIEQGQVRAREDARGTDAMIDGLVAENAQSVTRGGMLFKAPKPGQDRRVDLPTIGPVTATHAVAAGLDGIVIEQGGVIVLERTVVLDILNAAGMYLWVR